MSQKTVEALFDHIYTEPSRHYLTSLASPFYLIGYVRFSKIEFEKSAGSEGEFIALLTAEVKKTLNELGDLLGTPTLPVHDEPMPPEVTDLLVAPGTGE